MPTERKFKVFVASYPYGGNGGLSSEHPDVRNYLIKTVQEISSDPRVSEIGHRDYSDTPIPMTRNRSVKDAIEWGADFILMIDSDMGPDYRMGMDPLAKPFWQTSFDFCTHHYDRGPHVVCAPYCGPPPHENVYVFRWASFESDNPNPDIRIEAYSREEAAALTGIKPCAAQPTGLILFDIRAFDIIEPPWFYYEYRDEYETDKASTEDVTCTRDISLAGMRDLGYSPIYCNWDAWAVHHKPKAVGKPSVVYIDEVSEKYVSAVHNNIPSPGKPRIENVVDPHSKDGAVLRATTPSSPTSESNPVVDAVDEIIESVVGSKEPKPKKTSPEVKVEMIGGRRFIEIDGELEDHPDYQEFWRRVKQGKQPPPPPGAAVYHPKSTIPLHIAPSKEFMESL